MKINLCEESNDEMFCQIKKIIKNQKIPSKKIQIKMMILKRLVITMKKYSTPKISLN